MSRKLEMKWSSICKRWQKSSEKWLSDYMSHMKHFWKECCWKLLWEIFYFWCSLYVSVVLKICIKLYKSGGFIFNSNDPQLWLTQLHPTVFFFFSFLLVLCFWYQKHWCSDYWVGQRTSCMVHFIEQWLSHWKVFSCFSTECHSSEWQQQLRESLAN